MTLAQPHSDWHASHANPKCKWKILLASMVFQFSFGNICTYLNRAHSTLRISTLWINLTSQSIRYALIGLRNSSEKNWTNFTRKVKNKYEFNEFSNAKRLTTLLIVARAHGERLQLSRCGCRCSSVAQTIINDRCSRAVVGFYTLINCVCWMFILLFSGWLVLVCECVHAGRFVFWILFFFLLRHRVHIIAYASQPNGTHTHYQTHTASKLTFVSPSTLHSMPTELYSVYDVIIFFSFSFCFEFDVARVWEHRIHEIVYEYVASNPSFIGIHKTNQRRSYFTY